MELTFIHPKTHERVTREASGYRSPSGEFFPLEQGVPSFLPPQERRRSEEERSDFVNAVKTFLRRNPEFYVSLIWLISPVCYVKYTAQWFLKRYNADALIANIGSGVHRYKAGHMVNIDMYPYKGVDVIADATSLPFPDGTFDAALCECLLEHVTHPEKVVREILRVLKPGGQAFLTVPFVYPFHACPHDYYRWSAMGMRALCRDAARVEVWSRSGPASALVAQLVTFSAIIFSFGSERLYHVLNMLFLIPFAPFKFLDHIFGRFPTAHHGTEGLAVILTKGN